MAVVRPTRFTLSTAVLAIAFAGIAHTARSAGPPESLDEVRQVRAADQHVRTSIAGALVYLDDMQIRDRPGRNSCIYDYSGPDGKGCSGIRKVRNRVGEWASRIHLSMEGSKRTLLKVWDSNSFTTAGVSHPLFLFRDLGNSQFLAEIKEHAMSSALSYRRGEAYSFWPEIDGRTSKTRAVGPLNLNSKLFQKLKPFLTSKVGHAVVHLFIGKGTPLGEWLKRLSDRRQNPYGYDAGFNIPNDADDTAVLLALQALHAREFDSEVIPDRAMLRRLSIFRDIGRTRRDPRNSWAPDNSGAFLTWMKDEELAPFADPQKGVIPLGVNNVDCVVNANVLFSLALNGLETQAGFEDASRLLLIVAQDRLWQKGCGTYYPQEMMFPYVFSRALRDGGASNPELEQAAWFLIRDLLTVQNTDGTFPGGMDKTRSLSTALGTVALLNLGRDRALRAGVAKEFDSALSKALSYLVSARLPHRTFNTKGGLGYKWPAGLFFSASYWGLAQWRSEAYSTAIALEAFAKYLMAYDHLGVAAKPLVKLGFKANPQWDRDAERGDYTLELVPDPGDELN